MKSTTTETSTGKLVHEVYDDGDEIWKDYDSNNNCIHWRNSDGYEAWYDYDSNNRQIHWRNSDGYERWSTYDSNKNCIHERTSYGYEVWYDYDSNNKLIHRRTSNGYEYWYDENGKSIPKPKTTMLLNQEQRIKILTESAKNMIQGLSYEELVEYAVTLTVEKLPDIAYQEKIPDYEEKMMLKEVYKNMSDEEIATSLLKNGILYNSINNILNVIHS